MKESKLLLNTYPLIVLPELAQAIGLHEAIVLQQLHYWIEINRKADRNSHNGRYWTYNTYESWQVQFNRQGGRCAICGIHQSDLNTILHIDHNHVTGELRGLLCVKCNTGLGCFNTDTESVKLLELAVKYTKEAKWIV